MLLFRVLRIRENFIFWLVVCAACLTFRQATTRVPEGFLGLPAIWDISILQIWIWYELIVSSLHETVEGDATAYAVLMVIYSCCALLYPDIIFLFLLFSIFLLLILFKDRRSARLLSVSFSLIVFASLLTSSLFQAVHSIWAHVDAKVLWLSLSLIGVPALLHQTVIQLPGSDHSIIVEATCSSTWVLVLPLVTFSIVTLCRQGAFAVKDYIRLLLVVGCIFSLNIYRLSKMLPSRESWEYWHFGTGSNIFALASAMVVVLLVRARSDEG